MLQISAESATDQLENGWARKKKSADAMVRYMQGVGYVKKTKPCGKYALSGTGIDSSSNG